MIPLKQVDCDGESDLGVYFVNVIDRLVCLYSLMEGILNTWNLLD